MSSRFLTVLALSLALSAAATSAPQNRTNAASDYRHAYYLFLADPPNACEACYVPLLLSVAPLEEIANDPAGRDCDLITTYERDSIFQLNGIVHVAPRDVQPAPRTIRVRSRSYRYQEITAAEVLRLLENPQGTLPVSRPFLPSELPPGPSVDKLIAGFRAAK
ncbi:MAG TPA: hypothetical protein VJW51_06150 [Candidatus Acidoferrales bacterium]|nr:hypothetical protein [Candidatus Acidoferrales bacterium]